MPLIRISSIPGESLAEARERLAAAQRFMKQPDSRKLSVPSINDPLIHHLASENAQSLLSEDVLESNAKSETGTLAALSGVDQDDTREVFTPSLLHRSSENGIKPHPLATNLQYSPQPKVDGIAIPEEDKKPLDTPMKIQKKASALRYLIPQLMRPSPMIPDIATDEAAAKFAFGSKDANVEMNSKHPWTQAMKAHPHIANIRGTLRNEIAKHLGNDIQIGRAYSVPFVLDDQSKLYNVGRFVMDGFSYLGSGSKVYSTGSFEVNYTVESVDMEKGMINVRFDLKDKLRVGSLTRIPWGKISLIPDNPLGEKAPFNTINVHWSWEEVIPYQK